MKLTVYLEQDGDEFYHVLSGTYEDVEADEQSFTVVCQDIKLHTECQDYAIFWAGTINLFKRLLAFDDALDQFAANHKGDWDRFEKAVRRSASMRGFTNTVFEIERDAA